MEANNSAMHPAGLAEEIAREGYGVVTGVLEPTEIAELRLTVNRVLDQRGIHKALGTALPNAAVAAPEIAWVLTHERILRGVHEALGCAEPVFTLEADLHRNYVSRVWHKDTGEQVMDDGYFGLDPFGREDCRVIKVAIYLQDHPTRRGLRVRPRSHLSSDIGSGKGVNVASRAGDIVVFDVRLSHRGVWGEPLDVIAAGVSRLVPKSRRGRFVATLRRRMGAFTRVPDRVAVYFAFGIPNEQSDAFAARNMRRQLSQLEDRSIELPPQLLEAFAASRVRIADTSTL